MIKRLRIAVVLLVFVLGPWSVAHAGFIDWIDELSGPGPFKGFGGDFRLFCVGTENESAPAALKQSPPVYIDHGNWDWLLRQCLNKNLATKERPWISIDLSASYARGNGDKANLTYPVSSGNDKHVSVYSLAPAFWWAPIRPLAVGSAVGVNIFRGPMFSTFSRLQVTLVQVDFKPFATSRDDWFGRPWLNLVTIRAGYQLIPKGFTAEDFGATGLLNTEHESLLKVTVLFDTGSWSWIR